MAINSIKYDLFSRSNPIDSVNGLSYIPNFINEYEEQELLKKIKRQAWLTELKRRVQHYGYKYDYKARQISEDYKLGDIPSWLSVYSDKLYQEKIFTTKPDQIIINEYKPGQGISPHIDCVPCFGEVIASLSLGSDCIMEFTSQVGHKTPVFLERNSLVVLSGDARFKFKHGIAARKTDRYNGGVFKRSTRISLTFRSVVVVYEI